MPIELPLAGVSTFLAFLDAAITHFGLKGGRVEESNPAVLWVYQRLPPALFIALFALTHGALSLVGFHLFGPPAQWGLAAAGLAPVIWNIWLLFLTRKAG
ncbi:DUF5658 family protein [Phenylobacterium parvum]|uniref:DUF5658 domain-containing protein n=1 Tax=Phenylobacterium parvum TaxID=2201350 RepID=A0A2Z3HTE1_9CAUL|nr:DUF5658 family protein [Phenylobacterium parvum]AWM76641.1 hypothetical protein HYN04_01980 [Phenylobacterium parvum]